MATKFNVPITATDKTADGVRSAYRNFSTLTKPAERLEKATSRFSKGSAIGELVGKFASVNKIAGDMTGTIAEAAEGFGVFGGAVGATVAGVGILGVALGVAADKAIKFAAPIAAAGWEIARTSRLIDVNTQQLQAWRGAAQMNGVSSEAMTDSLNNLGNTLNDARWGRNNQALMLLHRLGIAIPYTAKGSVDASKAMLLLSNAMQRQDPQTRQTIAGIFGVAGALPLISQGARQVQRDLDAYAKSGAGMTDKQIAASEAYSKKLVELGRNWTHLKNDFAENIIIPWTTPFLDWLTKSVDLMDRLVSGKAKLFPKGNAVDAFTGTGPGKPMTGGAAFVENFWKSKGYTPGQARGMAAGMLAENGKLSLGMSANGAFGLGQWRGARQKELFRRYGPNPTRDQQLEFLAWELQTKRGANGVGELDAGNAIRAQGDAHSAMRAYITQFERPGWGTLGDFKRGEQALESGNYAASDVVAAQKKAAPAAQAAAANLAGQLPPTPGTTFTLPSDADAAGGATAGKVKVDITLRNAPPGTVARTQTSGDVAASTGIEHSMSSLI